MLQRLISRWRGSPFAFPLAALTALAMFWISEASYQDAKVTFDVLGERATARTQIQSLRHALAEAETGQRGYLLSGRKEYLQPYTDSLTTIDRTLAWLRAFYAHDPVNAATMRRLESLSQEKLSELSTTLRLREQDPGGGWRDLMLTNIGQEKMDTIRALSNELLAVETANVARGRESVYQTLLLNRIGVSAMTALSLLALFMYLRQTAALDRQRAEQQNVVQAERDRLEGEVSSRTAQLKELALHLQTVREDERRHLARELHDELGALLTAAKLDAARLKSRLGAMTPEVSQRMAHLNEALNSGIALKRRIIEDLRPSSLSNLGLAAALEILVREFSARVEIEVASDLQPVSLGPSAELTVYRLVQEALTNIAKYARATQISVSVRPVAGGIEVCVRDDGIGFDTALPQLATHGLLGMKFRVESENGTMTIASPPGHGTTIAAVLPQAPAVPEEDELAAQSAFS
ncbi:MAG: CHASE3 domain-containing protein [Pseudomonadota bacterium]|nr:CHASE3 domain-containing protein [Pseudomonadota bacterium]